MSHSERSSSALLLHNVLGILDRDPNSTQLSLHLTVNMMTAQESHGIKVMLLFSSHSELLSALEASVRLTLD